MTPCYAGNAMAILRSRCLRGGAVLCLVAAAPFLGARELGASDISAAIGERLSTSGKELSVGGMSLDPGSLRQIYQGRAFRPFWVSGGGASLRLSSVLDRLRGAAEDGLDPSAYGAEAIAARMSATSPESRAELDLLVTGGLFRYARDIRFGRVPTEVADANYHQAPPSGDVARLIQEIVGAPDIVASLAALPPRDPRYARLKSALVVYRAIEARGGWPLVQAGPTLKPGMSDPRVGTLRRRLAATGDVTGNRAGDSYDAALERAVRRFQRRHGLLEDGVVGRHTLEAFNLPVAARIRQIILNLERRRWLAWELGTRYVFVNIADATVKYVERRDEIERTLLDMRAVVGRPYRRTPVFSARMTHLVVNPSWYVPASIARKDIVPKAAGDPRFLSAEGFQVLSGAGPGGAAVDPSTIDWAGLRGRSFPYLLRQRPGPLNALGRIKFLMPNRFDVYLHDTPARDLLTRSARAFSSGCIRLEKPLELGLLALGARPEWSRETVEAAIASGQTQTIALPEPVPVHISYLTAWVNKDGAVHFRPDIYGRDARLARALDTVDAGRAGTAARSR